MFLDEEIYQIGKDISGENYERITKELFDLITTRTQNKAKELLNTHKLSHYASILRKTNIMWNMGIKKIIKENKMGNLLIDDLPMKYFKEFYPEIYQKVWVDKIYYRS